MKATIGDGMQLDWKGFLANGAPPDHGVQVYQDLSELAYSVGAYLASGFDAGEPAVVIATPSHWQTFAAQLTERGWRDTRLDESGLLTLLDAKETLASFMVGRRPSQQLFRETIGSLLDDVEARYPGRRIRAFGEMVDGLCDQGNPGGAAALERLWHNLLHERPRFSLLCGYQLDPFAKSAQLRVLPSVCETHSHVMPASDPKRFQESVDAALHHVLGPLAATVYLKVAESAPDRQVPRGMLALLWVSANMPTQAERILETTRRNYESLAASA